MLVVVNAEGGGRGPSKSTSSKFKSSIGCAREIVDGGFCLSGCKAASLSGRRSDR